ncbi:hypothetical protein HDV00_003561 [Rhizophlyctis rosea]|nr:hypothetical protein HDV00_003561 [Rhizophlyctis rosea]
MSSHFVPLLRHSDFGNNKDIIFEILSLPIQIPISAWYPGQILTPLLQTPNTWSDDDKRRWATLMYDSKILHDDLARVGAWDRDPRDGWEMNCTWQTPITVGDLVQIDSYLEQGVPFLTVPEEINRIIARYVMYTQSYSGNLAHLRRIDRNGGLLDVVVRFLREHRKMRLQRLIRLALAVTDSLHAQSTMSERSATNEGRFLNVILQQDWGNMGAHDWTEAVGLLTDQPEAREKVLTAMLKFTKLDAGAGGNVEDDGDDFMLEDDDDGWDGWEEDGDEGEEEESTEGLEEEAV